MPNQTRSGRVIIGPMRYCDYLTNKTNDQDKSEPSQLSAPSEKVGGASTGAVTKVSEKNTKTTCSKKGNTAKKKATGNGKTALDEKNILMDQVPNSKFKDSLLGAGEAGVGVGSRDANNDVAQNRPTSKETVPEIVNGPTQNQELPKNEGTTHIQQGDKRNVANANETEKVAVGVVGAGGEGAMGGMGARGEGAVGGMGVGDPVANASRNDMAKTWPNKIETAPKNINKTTKVTYKEKNEDTNKLKQGNKPNEANANKIEGAVGGVGIGGKGAGERKGGGRRGQDNLLNTQAEYVPKEVFEKLSLEMEQMKIAILAVFGVMTPENIEAIGKSHLGITNTVFGEFLNLAMHTAEFAFIEREHERREATVTEGLNLVENNTDRISDGQGTERNAIIEIGEAPNYRPSQPAADGEPGGIGGVAEGDVTPPPIHTTPQGQAVTSAVHENYRRDWTKVNILIPQTQNDYQETLHQNNENYLAAQRMMERNDIERRGKNIIIKGIRETDQNGDIQAIHQVLDYLNAIHRIQQIVRIVRLGRKNGRNRPIKVIFDQKSAAEEILDKCPRLSHSILFDMVHIKRDLPLGQRINNSNDGSLFSEAARSNMSPTHNTQNTGAVLSTYENIDERNSDNITSINNITIVDNTSTNSENPNDITEEVRQPQQLSNDFFIRSMYGDGDEGYGGEREAVGGWMEIQILGNGFKCRVPGVV